MLVTNVFLARLSGGLRLPLAYPFTSIFFGATFSLFGRAMVSTPSWAFPPC